MATLINLAPPKIVRASKMLKVAKDFADDIDEELFKGLVLPEVPPRSISSLLSALSANESHTISLLEWFTIFEAEKFFGQQAINQNVKYRNLIWKEIRQQKKVRQIAFWRMCLYFDGQKYMLPQMLMDNLQGNLTNIKNIDKKKAQVLLAISECKADDLAYYALQSAISSKALLSQLGLPSNINFAVESDKNIEKALIKQGISKLSENYLQIISSYPTLSCDKAVSRLILASTPEQLIECSLLFEFIKKRYSPHTRYSRWGKLEPDIQSQLKEAFGKVYFYDFKKFIFQITAPELAEALSLTASEIRQLKSRVTFWSNYQTRFHNFKIFMPLKTIKIIETFGLSIPEHSIVSGLKNERYETELCSLEFEKHIVVEYLRGGSSSLKVYLKYQKTIDVLLKVQKLTIHELEHFSPLKEHDHLVFWQNSCEKMLRTQLKILPDKKVRNFLIVEHGADKDNHTVKYSAITGLPRLKIAEESKRRKMLEKNSIATNKSILKFEDGDRVLYLNQVFTVWQVLNDSILLRNNNSKEYKYIDKTPHALRKLIKDKN